MAQRHADDLFFYCTLGIILGGRLGYATFYTGGASGIPSMWAHPADLAKLWQGGMSFHGGLIGTVIASGWVCWRNRLPFIRVCDFFSPCVPPAIFLIRCANFVNGELWGKVTDSSLPWAMVFPGAGPLPRHPSQLYEAALEGILLGMVLFPLFWKTRARERTGLITGVFLLGYGVIRMSLELVREPDAQLQDFARATHLSMGQWLSLPLVLIGLVLLVRAFASAEAAPTNRPEPA
jgi:phosphatidylglycerol:prolipoprotein diacylglycerol transferase